VFLSVYLLQKLWLRFEQRRIDIRPGLVPLQTIWLPSRIIIRQTIIPTSHYIKSPQITTREFHGSEELVPHIWAENGILTFGYLRGQTHQYLFHTGVSEKALQNIFFYKYFLNQKTKTHARVPPSGAKSDSWIAHGRFLKVALTISPINSRWNHRVAKSKGSRLEYVTNARMYILFVPIIWWQWGAQKGGQILVDYNILQTGNHRVSCPLVNVLITPIRMQTLDPLSQSIMPAQEENGEGQDRRVLVGARIAKNWE